MPADTITSKAPDAKFLFSHPAHFIALGFGSGLVPKAPGTFGTLAGLGLYYLLALFLPPIVIAFLAVPLFFVGIWACDKTGRDLGVKDHGAMVIDEIVAYLPLAAVAFASPWLQAVTFALFRLFDIWKPPPIRTLEAKIEGGLGVMIDDIVAAFYAYVCFVIFVVVMHKGFGFQ